MINKKEYNRKYYQEHKKQLSEYKREWYKVHGSANRLKVKKEVLTHYGNGKCACVRCGFDDIRALSIDHIEPIGEKKRFSSGYAFYRWLIKNSFPEGYQTLCMNCQFIKGDKEDE